MVKVPTIAEKMSVDRYLKRIGYIGPRSPTIEVLRHLHRRHLLSVRFENLGIHFGKPTVLDEKVFYRKIIDDRRGGYCYELNGCFAWLLKRLGFRVSMLSARVASKDGGFSPEFDHMTLLVRMRECWLADVGFGDSFTQPKKLDTADPQKDEGHFYKVTSSGRNRLVLRRPCKDGSWEPQYAFNLRSHRLADFAAWNRYQQTSPRSPFTQV